MAATVTAPREVARPCEEQVRERRDGRHCAAGSGRRGTLAQLLEAAHTELRAVAATECPVCGGAMARVEPQGRCRDCGSTLA